MARSRTTQFPLLLHVAFGVLGVTLGLYAGWSASPVVGSLVTGVFGLFSGGVLVAFLFRKVGDQLLVEPTAAPAVALSIILVCVTAVLGTIFGINIRNGTVGAIFVSEKHLVSIPAKHASLPPSVTAKLVVLQHSLEQMGYDRTDNNRLIKSLADAVQHASESEGRNVHNALQVASQLKQKISQASSPLDPKDLLTVLNAHPFDDEKAFDAFARFKEGWTLNEVEGLDFLLEHTYVGRAWPQSSKKTGWTPAHAKVVGGSEE